MVLSSSADAAGAATTPGSYTPMLYIGSLSYAGTSGSIAADGVYTYTWDPSGSSLVGVGTAGGGTGGVLALTNTHGDVIGQFTGSGASNWCAMTPR